MRYNGRMAILVMLGWWYSRGWAWLLRDTQDHLARVGSTFAVRVLLRTWFAPWKQITSPTTFRNFFQSAIDNGISRLIGGIVRTGILFVALLFSITIIIFGICRLILWPFIPFGIVILPILGLFGGNS